MWVCLKLRIYTLVMAGLTEKTMITHVLWGYRCSKIGSIGVSFLEVLNQTATGWWFGTFFKNEFPYIGNVIPTD